ncbi:hypothetical protein [Streptomyces sp. UNOC14_S4]|uniref:hypothetical protein n=1 Tax=Streptomyces sp. UNOC14_S4 TaxID=2872340 RepID=UPI001E4D04F3|nr:hypothetical protein [Streptomyces sp. UNOC14_S4]MCC3766320.1 hypothetical protein [Streptomyces sp. UNOC14_S4]
MTDMPRRLARAAADLPVGEVVFDARYGLTGILTRLDGPVAYISRPTGFDWCTRRSRVRPASEEERRRYDALIEMHEAQVRFIEASAAVR